MYLDLWMLDHIIHAPVEGSAGCLASSDKKVDDGVPAIQPTLFPQYLWALILKRKLVQVTIRINIHIFMSI